MCLFPTFQKSFSFSRNGSSIVFDYVCFDVRSSNYFAKKKNKAWIFGARSPVGGWHRFDCMCFSFVVSFFPAQTSSVIPSSVYTLVVLAVVVILGIPPLVFYALRKPNWDRRTEVEKQATVRLEKLEEEK